MWQVRSTLVRNNELVPVDPGRYAEFIDRLVGSGVSRKQLLVISCQPEPRTRGSEGSTSAHPVLDRAPLNSAAASCTHIPEGQDFGASRAGWRTA